MEKRILAISDIHGCYDKFMELLEKVKYNSKEDQLVLLGDYTDRGSNNVKVLKEVVRLVKEGAVALLGNHDEMVMDTLLYLLKDNALSSIQYNPYELQLHLRNGGHTTLKELFELTYEEKRWFFNFLNGLSLVHKIDNYIFVHAGVDASQKLDDNNHHEFLWIREQFLHKKAYDGKIVVFGHTPTKYLKPVQSYSDMRIWHDLIYKDKIGIDCGCVFGGKLACLELPSMVEYYV